MRTFLLCVFIFFWFFLEKRVLSFDSPNRFTKSLSPSLHRKTAKEVQQEYFELALPLPSDRISPSCTHPILRHSFAHTIDGPPFSTPYAPPSDFLSASWSSVAVEFRAKCRGEQYDRIAAVWIGGVEILRTSTAEPTESGIFWKLRKDVTRYSSILSRSGLNLTMMLENIVDDEFTGIYHVEIDLLFYNRTVALASAAEKPADLIIPISDSGERGFWFRLESESDAKSKEVSFPRNTRQAILELCVSFHGNDEFWYSNPPNSYVDLNDLKTRRANGAYREIFATVDGDLAGAEFPFPVIFTGGINPLFWEPIVAIGAFNLPTYDIELTPFLGRLLDGKSHRIGIGVSDGISYWLMNANLHLWLDPISQSVQANTKPGLNPALVVKRASQFKGLDGVFKIKAERTFRSTGWVMWSAGNHTTSFSQHYKLKNTITYCNGGSHKTVDQKVSVTKEVSVSDATGRVVRQESQRKSFPLRVVTARVEGKVEGEYVALSNVSHSVKGQSFLAGDRIGKRRFSNKQVSGGWMEVKGHSVISGSAETRQRLLYSDSAGCFRQSVSTRDAQILRNDTSFLCLSLYPLSSST